MLNKENVFLDVEVTSKEEALQFVSKQALELAITDNETGLYEDFIKREGEFSTGLLDGFAIPHAKSTHALKTSIIFVRLANAIEWETMDDEPVRYLFALIVPMKNAGDDHLMMISKLSTNLLEDDFRQEVKSCDDKEQLVKYIYEKMKEEN